MKKTKIVVTVGPAAESVEMLQKLLRAGADIFRLNFSQAGLDQQQKRVDNIRAAVKNTGLPAQIMQDLPGPKIRIGDFRSGSAVLKEGDIFTLTTDDCLGDQTRVSVSYPLLSSEILPGSFIYIDDGKRKLQVLEIKGANVVCQVLAGGEIRNRNGLNLPGAKLSVKALTEKDRADLDFGIENKLDFVAMSFVRAASDILELREILDEKNCAAKTVAKIETPQAVENIDAIIAAADWLMVARGDLAIEIPFEKVPIVQKMITEKCNAAGKPTIVATQMMESMVVGEMPTRAEASDVANAVLDGAEAVMLSEETALGANPELVVADMALIIEETERDAGMVRNEIGG